MPVVSREYIARSARRRRPGGAGGVRLEALRYGGMDACMSNRGRSPVEW